MPTEQHRADPGEEMTRTTIRMPIRMKTELEQLARKNRRSFSNELIHLIELHLERARNQRYDAD
jgi:predicted DNA-binding protein